MVTRFQYCTIFGLLMLAGAAGGENPAFERSGPTVTGPGYEPAPHLELRPEALPAPSGGTIIRVGNAGACNYSTLPAAVAAANDGDTIHIAYSAVMLTQTLNVFGKSLTIRGGFPNCSANDPTSVTLLNASGSSRRVFDFWASGSTQPRLTLQLENLLVTGGSITGDYPDGVGGGILVDGPSSQMNLRLINTVVFGNSATFGGGVALVSFGHSGTGTNFWLFADADSQISANSATNSGGGLYCQDAQTPSFDFIVRLEGAALVDNTATEHGGGGFFDNCRNVQLLARGSSNGMRIRDNTATNGDGGAIHATNFARVSMSGANEASDPLPRRGVNLYRNQADRGGAIAATNDAEVSVNDGRIHNNQARRGGAVLSQNNALVRIRRGTEGGCSLQPDGTQLINDPPILCSQVSHNQSTQVGGAFYVPNSGRLHVERSYIWGNQAGAVNSGVLELQAGGQAINHAIFESSLIAGNQAGFGLFNVRNARLELLGTTITANTLIDAVDSTALFVRADAGQSARARVRGSILWQPGRQLAARIGNHGTVAISTDCLIGSMPFSESGFTGNLAYSFIDPEFRAPGALDFRPGPTSPAIDYCDGGGGLSGLPDIAGRSRGQEYGGPTTPAPGSITGGVFDLGAWEMRLDGLFKDRFEQ